MYESCKPDSLFQVTHAMKFCGQQLHEETDILQEAFTTPAALGDSQMPSRAVDAQPDEGLSRQKLKGVPQIVAQSRVDARKVRRSARHDFAATSHHDASLSKRLKLESRDYSAFGLPQRPPSPYDGRIHNQHSRGSRDYKRGAHDPRSYRGVSHTRLAKLRSDRTRNDRGAPPISGSAIWRQRAASHATDPVAGPSRLLDAPSDDPLRVRRPPRVRKSHFKGSQAGFDVLYFSRLPALDEVRYVERFMEAQSLAAIDIAPCHSPRQDQTVKVVLHTPITQSVAATLADVDFEGRTPLIRPSRENEARLHARTATAIHIHLGAPSSPVHDRRFRHSPEAVPKGDFCDLSVLKEVDVLVHQLSRACDKNVPWHKQTMDREIRQALADAAQDHFQVEDHYVKGLQLFMEGRRMAPSVQKDQPVKTVPVSEDNMCIGSGDGRDRAEEERVIPSTPVPPNAEAPDGIVIPGRSKKEEFECIIDTSHSASSSGPKQHADVSFPFPIYETISPSRELLQNVHLFLQTFLQLFDESRGSLIDYYTANATFSYSSVGTLPHFPPILRVRSRDIRKNGTTLGLATTPSRILTVLRTLPPVQHDFSAPFSFDHWTLDDQGTVLCTINGEWEEFLTSETRSYSRTLVLVPVSANNVIPGLLFQVQSDQLIIRPPSVLYAELRTDYCAETERGDRSEGSLQVSPSDEQSYETARDPGVSTNLSAQTDADIRMDLEADGPVEIDRSEVSDLSEPRLEDSIVAFFTPPSKPGALQRRTKMRAFFDVGSSYLAVAKSGDIFKWSKKEDRQSVKHFHQGTVGAAEIHCAAHSPEHDLLFLGHEKCKAGALAQLSCVRPRGKTKQRVTLIEERHHIDGISALCVLPVTGDRVFLASAGWDHNINVHRLDAEDLSQPVDVEGLPATHRSVIQTLAWSTLRDCLISSGADGWVLGWDLAAMTQKPDFKWKEPSRVNQAQICEARPDLLLLTLGYHEDQLRLYDVRNAAPVSHFGFASPKTLNLTGFARGAFSPDGQLFALPAEDKVRIWDLRSTKQPAHLLSAPSPGSVAAHFESRRELTVLEACSFAYHRVVL